MLAELIADTTGDVGAQPVLSRFLDWRARDRPGAALLRNLGLLVFDLAPPAKEALARVSAGFGGPTPRLARGLSLRHV